MLKRFVNSNFDDEAAIRHRFEAELIKGLVKGKKILDVGCWTGQFLSLIQDSANCHGIDPGKDTIKFAQKKELEHIPLVQL